VVNRIESKFRWYLERCGFSSFLACGTQLKVHVRVSSHDEVAITSSFFGIFQRTLNCVHSSYCALYENLRHETWHKTDKCKGFQKKSGLQFTGISGLLWTMIYASLEAEKARERRRSLYGGDTS
jgi:hypothetical protein